jgi:hypothetical protein
MAHHLQAYDAAIESGRYKRVEPSKYPSLETVLQLVAMGLELYRLCPEFDIQTQQRPWSLNLFGVNLSVCLHP